MPILAALSPSPHSVAGCNTPDTQTFITMTFKSTVISLICFGLLLAGGWYWLSQATTKAPNVTFTTLKGQTLHTSQLQGKLVVVSFWATDCPACVEEIPHWIDLHRQFAEQGLTILAVAMHYDPPNHVLAMAESKQLPYNVVLDPNGSLAQAFGNVQLTPTTFLMDRNGNIILHKTGALAPETILQKLREQGLAG